MTRASASCKSHFELFPAIASGAPVPLSKRGEALHHAEHCLPCSRNLAALRNAWETVAPGSHPDPEPSDLLDGRVARAISSLHAHESSVTAIPIVLPRESEQPVRRHATLIKVFVGLAAALAVAVGLWTWASQVAAPGTLGGRSGYSAHETVSRMIESADPADAIFIVEQALQAYPSDPLLWRLLGERGASSYDLEAMCLGIGRYLELAPEAPDRVDVTRLLDDRLAAMDVEACPETEPSPGR